MAKQAPRWFSPSVDLPIEIRDEAALRHFQDNENARLLVQDFLQNYFSKVQEGVMIKPSWMSAVRISSLEISYELATEERLQILADQADEAIEHFKKYIGNALIFPRHTFAVPDTPARVSLEVQPHLEDLAQIYIVMVSKQKFIVGVEVDYKSGNHESTIVGTMPVYGNSLASIEHNQVVRNDPNGGIRLQTYHGNILWQVDAASGLDQIVSPASELMHAALSPVTTSNIETGMRLAKKDRWGAILRRGMLFDEYVVHGVMDCWEEAFANERGLEKQLEKSSWPTHPDVIKMRALVLKKGPEYVLKSYGENPARLVSESGVAFRPAGAV